MRVLCVLALVPLLLHARLCQAQSFTARPGVSIAPHSGGFYEYLPQGYSSGSARYPLIVFCHGVGESGNGNSDLPILLNQGLPKLINQGQFPASFTSGSQTFRFLVISPQFTPFPPVADHDLDSVIRYAIDHYRVDSTRIYLTGLSMGGGMVWDYVSSDPAKAARIAAIVPICGAILNPAHPVIGDYASSPDSLRARNITAANLPVWATHNDNDPTVPVSFTNDYIRFINAPPPPTPLAKKTIFSSFSHDAWTQTYHPSFTDAGLNIYEWMLQYTRTFVALPVTLSRYEAFQSGAAEITVAWSVAEAVNNDHFTIEHSSDGVHFTSLATLPAEARRIHYAWKDVHPVKGVNFYRLSQTDRDGAIRRFRILRVNLNADGKATLSVSPNPVQTSLELRYESESTGRLELSLAHAGGTVLQSWTAAKDAYSWSGALDLSRFPSGTYYLTLRQGQTVQTQAVVKK